jgi:hypothetical protein
VRIARLVLRLAASILRPVRPEWAQAMEHEFEHLDGNQRALAWALGCLRAACEERLVGKLREKAPSLLKWYLALMIVLNLLTAVAILLYISSVLPVVQIGFPHVTQGQLTVFTIIPVANVACALALWRHKQWGLWGVLGITVISACVNVFKIGLTWNQLVLGLLNFPILAILYFMSEGRNDHSSTS